MKLYIIEYESAHFSDSAPTYCVVWADNADEATLTAGDHMDVNMYELYANDYDEPDDAGKYPYAYSDEQCHKVNWCDLFTDQHPHREYFLLDSTQYPEIGTSL